jgi:nitrogen-specific signal transduction histidine kinase
MDLQQQEKGGEDEILRKLKHDIKNQLSNIHLALEQLKYELPELNDDGKFYVDMIVTSATKINTLLNEVE